MRSLDSAVQIPTPRRILTFWLPLLATWQMMSIEGPFLAAIIARLADAKFNLAAYGVAFSLALIIESPIIMMMTASTALVKGKLSYLRLRNFTAVLNIGITLLMLLLVLPPVFTFVSEDLMKLPTEVARITHTATALLLPWPAAIGFRRFYQGLLIRYNMTRRVAWGTMIRLLAMTATALVLAIASPLPGAVVATAALSVGVVLEAVASRFMVHGTIASLLEDGRAESGVPTYPDIYRFYYPLALTSILALGVHPMVAFFLGQSRMPLESLAVMPVINSLVFIFRSFGLSYQEVAVSQLGPGLRHYAPVRNFAFWLGLAAVAGLSIVAFTPIAHLWFRQLSGLGEDLALFALLPTQLLVIMPGTSVLLSLQRSILVVSKRTSTMTTATVVEVVLILAVLYAAIVHFEAIGAIAASIALLTGRIGANLFLLGPVRKARAAVREQTPDTAKQPESL
jgi:progressive ankylosis protein